MAQEFWSLKEDGYLNVDLDSQSIVYHPTLNIILVITRSGYVHVLDVNSGVVLQTSSLCAKSNSLVKCQYLEEQNKVLFLDGQALGVRSDYNGVLLLDTILQRRLKSSDETVKLELLLSEAVIFQQSLKTIDLADGDSNSEVLAELAEKIDRAQNRPKTGIKAQKWNTICLELRLSALRGVAHRVVSELKRQGRHVPALAVAAAVVERLAELGPREWTVGAKTDRAAMHSEARRRETFVRWPHMDYKWALPEQMAQAGFYHQPNSSGDDRAMCFTCAVCLVCWERTDEPWSEHERHSPSCPFVKGEYTQNVPLSVTYATSPALEVAHGAIAAHSNVGDLVALGHSSGMVTVHDVAGKAKRTHCFYVTHADHYVPELKHDVLKRENLVTLTALSIVGEKRSASTPQPHRTPTKSMSASPQKSEAAIRPAVVCGITVSMKDGSRYQADAVNEKSDPSPSVKALNDHNQQKNESTPDIMEIEKYNDGGGGDDDDDERSRKYLYLVVYDFLYKSAACERVDGPKDISYARDDAKALDIEEIVDGLTSSNPDKSETFIKKCSELLMLGKLYVDSEDDANEEPCETASDAIESAIQETAEPVNVAWEVSPTSYKNFIPPENDKIFIPSEKPSEPHDGPRLYTEDDGLLDAMYHADKGVEYSFVDGRSDGGDRSEDPYGEPGPSSDKSISDHISDLKSRPDAKTMSYSHAVQCVVLPERCQDRDLRISEIVPTKDGGHVLVVLRPTELDVTAASVLLVYDLVFSSRVVKIKEKPTLVGELSGPEQPEEVSLLPVPEGLENSGALTGLAAIVCVDGAVRLVDLATLNVVSEAKVDGARYVSATYCNSLERLCVCTERGPLHFYAISGRDNDFVEEQDEEDYGVGVDRGDDDRTSPSFVRNVSAGSSVCEEHDRTHVADRAPHASALEDSYAKIFSDVATDRRAFTVAELRLLHSLCRFEPRSVAYCAVLPPCWTEMQQCQRKESGSPFTRTWRLQTDATTWDEHVLELTLPWAECVGHVDLRFSLHAPCPSLPNIQVTLLKQHASGIGFRKFPMPTETRSPAVDEPVDFPLLDGSKKNCARSGGFVQSSVLTDEYLRARNADVLAGPVGLSSCLDLSEHGGCVTLTSPKLLRARGRTMLIHVKALLDVSKGLPSDDEKTGNGPKKCRAPEPNFSGVTSISTGSAASNGNATAPGFGFENFMTNRKTEYYIGCDWLHEISISVRQMGCVNYPNERAQRITMVESNSLLDALCATVCGGAPDDRPLARALALEILEWIAAVRLGRRGGEFGASLLRALEPHLYDLIKTVLVAGTRSSAHKLTKLLIVCVEGGRNMTSSAVSQQFDGVLLQSLLRATDVLGSIRSASALRWFALLLQHVAGAAPCGAAAVGCLGLLRRAAEEFRTRTNVYHRLLRSRFGLYGTPFDPSLFDVEPPQLLKSTSVPVTFASVVAGDLFAAGPSGSGAATSSNGVDGFDPKDLFSVQGVSANGTNQDPKQVSRCRGLVVNNHTRGLLETEPLHYACVSASDGTRLERYETSGADASPVVAPMIPTVAAPVVQQYFTLGTSANPNETCPVFDGAEPRENAGDKTQDADAPGVPSDEMIYLSMDSDTSDSPVQVSVVKAGSWSTLRSADEKETVEPDDARDERRSNNDKKANHDPSNGSASRLPWQQLLIPPPHQMLVVERMHSGARRFVVLDFGAPVLLTDMLVPACADLVSLSVDVWWHNEDVDSVRLATASDIGAKSLVLTDLQPAPLCRFIKITIIGRYGMSTTRCKIPIGHFYGHVVVLPEDTYGNAETEVAVPTRPYVETQLSALAVLLEDIECRYTMALSRLRNLLDPLLATPTDSPSAHCTNAYLRIVRETKDFGDSSNSKSANSENAQTIAAYQKCVTYQHQLNLIRNVVARLEAYVGRRNADVPDESRRLTEASTDKLRSICECFLGVLINIVYEVGTAPRVDPSLFESLDRPTCEELFTSLCVGNDSRLQLSVASLLVRTCGLQPWWGEFLSDSITRLYASRNTAVFPQERLFVILAYLGRKSLSNGASRAVVLDPVLRGLCAQLRPLADVPDSRKRLVAAKTDLGLLGWSLLFLSFCLDAPRLEPNGDESNRTSSSRWDWLVAEAGVDRSASSRNGTADGYRRKLHKRFLHYKQQLDHLDLTQKAMQASTQALSALSNHAANLSTKLEVVLKQQEHFFKKIKQFKTKQIEDMKSKRHEHDGRRSEATYRREPSQTGGDAGVESLDHAHCLVVARGLIVLILNVDCTCNVDLFLLSCKTIARLITTTRPILSLRQLVTPAQAADLLRMAIRSESNPWVSHAIGCLLQDMLEGHRIVTGRSPEPNADDAIYETGSEAEADNTTNESKWSAPNLDAQSSSSVDGIVVFGDMLAVDENDGDLNAMSSKSNGVPLPSLPESDDSELDDVLDDILERGRHLLRKTSTTKSCVLPTSSYSAAIDARLDVGLDGMSEIILRRLTTLSSCYLPVAVNASLNAPLEITAVSALEPWPAELLASWSDPSRSSELGNVTILTECFDRLFAELEFSASASILEQTLQLWLTLSVNLSDTANRSNGGNASASNPFIVPGLTLSPASISHLLSALTCQPSVSLRAWTLAFQCLTLAANLPYPETSAHADGGFWTGNDIERSLNGMAGYVAKDAKFPQMLSRFFSGNSVSLSEKRFAGPSVCRALHELITRLQIRADVVTVGSRSGRSLKNVLLRTLQRLLEPGTGPLTTPARGPLDAHCKFVQSLLLLNFVDADLDVTMSVVESIGVLVHNYMSQVESVKCIGLAEQGGSQTSCFGSLFSSVLGTDASKHGKPVTYDNLIISLLKLATKLIQTPLPSPTRTADVSVVDVESNDDDAADADSSPANRRSSQTDESNVERRGRATNARDVDRGPAGASCIADNVLQHVPTVLRLCRTLSTCSGSSLAMLVGAMPHHCTVGEIGEPGSVADAVFQLLAALAAKASDVQLLLRPLLRFLSTDGPPNGSVSERSPNENTARLSEPLVWWLLQVLSTETALREFTVKGGVRLLAEHLVRCQRAALATLQPAAISQVMQHLSAGNNAPAAGLAYQGGTANSKKTQQANIENNEALVNFAPLGVITSTSPTAQPADVLIQASVAPHRRARTPQWSYHFYPDESHVELCVSLPAAVLLREVQLQPHLNSLATCPSAITLEASRTGSSGFVPLCPPLPTSGMSFIRLHLPVPEVVTDVLVRLYKPRDSTNIGLLQIRLLGTAAFGGVNNKTSVNDLCDEERLTKSSLGWLRLLHQCFDLPAAESKLNAVVVGEAAQVPGLLEACCGLVLVPTQIPPLFVPNLERVLLKLSLHDPESSLQTMRMLLNNSAASIQFSREPDDRTIESVCELLFKLCTTRDRHTERRVRAAVEWLHGAARSALSNANDAPPSSSYVQCVASVLWSTNRVDVGRKLGSFVTREFFEDVYRWTTITADRIALKKALDSVLCSSCAINEDFFALLLEKTGVLVPGPSAGRGSDGPVERDDDAVGGSETPSRPTVCDPRTLFLDESRLRTIAAAARSPSVTERLLESGLPKLLVSPLTEFFTECYEASSETSSYARLDDVVSKGRNGRPTVRTSGVVNILNFFSDCCTENAMREWLGSTDGSVFWIPLMRLLSRGRSSTSNGPRSDELRELEDATVRFVTRCCSLCPGNQTLLAVCLCEVIENDAGISGFVRRLVLQFLLENEKVWVHVKADETIYARSSRVLDGFGPHPAFRITNRHVLLRLDTCTTLSEILDKHVSYTAAFASRRESLDPAASPTAKYPKKDVWEVALDMTDQMSVAAGVTAKDKRAKDAKNLALCSTGTGQASNDVKKKDAAASSDSAPCCENSAPAKGNRTLVCDQLPRVALPPSTKLSNILAKSNRQILQFTIVQSGDDGPVGMTDAQIEAEFGRLKSPLEVFSMWEGLEILAQHLPLVYTETSRSFVGLTPSGPVPAAGDSSEQDWVKVEGSEDIYEDLEEAGTGAGGAASRGSQAATSMPPHSLAAFGLFLRLPWYAETLLRDYKKAQCLLRLVLGVTDDGEGGDIFTSPIASSLPTLPFQVLKRLYDAIPIATDDSRLLRRKSIEYGVVRLLLSCLSVFTHHSGEMVPHASVAMLGAASTRPADGVAPPKTTDDKSHLYWAKGTGFGTGSTHQSWNVEQALLRQRSEEEHVTVLLQVLSSYIDPGGTVPDSEDAASDPKGGAREPNDTTENTLPASFRELLRQSCLLPALCSYLRNDSVLDMARHIPLYRAVLRLLRAVAIRPQLVSLLLPEATERRPDAGSAGAESCGTTALSVVSLLANMKLCVDTYASRLKVNKKPCSSPTTLKTSKLKFTSTDASEESESDEGLALLIPDIQTTAELVRAAVAERCSRLDGDANTSSGTGGGGHDVGSYGAFDGLSKPLKQSLEHRYIEVMKRLQFDTFEMIRECTETEGGGYQFVVSYHFENNVRTAGDRSHPARVKRLAQEAVTLATSLPLSYSSSVFVRCDADRLDVMKVLITGPADTPYANGCFELDVYFPPDYPQAPMMINLETTGRHTVRFNPNLYNDGKVCLSVLNTWHGRPEEKWNAHTSSFLQVLVSIQSLILVPEPYFNEPGYERSRGSPSGTQSSLEYNANICQATVRWAMLEQIRNPCPCFKQVVHTHFWLKRHEVAAQIEKWIAELESQSPEKRTNNRTSSKRVQAANALALKHHYFQLHEELSRLKTPEGLEDLEEASAMRSLPPLTSLPFNATSTPIAETFPSVVIPVSDTPDSGADQSAAADVHHDIDTDVEMEKMVSKVCE